jgi:molybdopterin-guanine dinucleotide biosynthesis protein A
VILAGGRGRRIGGAKATVELCGRPLIEYPIRALRAALGEVAIMAKADTALPSLTGVAVWIEPTAASHPLLGIVHALHLAEGRPVLVCAADMPFVTAALVARIAATDPGGAPAVVPVCDGQLQPLLALYMPAAAATLSPGVLDTTAPLRQAVAGLEPRLIEIDDWAEFFNVNTPEDLLHASALLRGR